MCVCKIVKNNKDVCFIKSEEVEGTAISFCNVYGVKTF